MKAEEELLRKLHARGLISYKPIFYIELDNKVNQLIKSGMAKDKAVKEVARLTGVCRATVYRARKLLK